MQTLAYIPARDSSTRLPMKNVAFFNGKSLVENTIDQARDANIFDRIILSSNSKDILQLGDTYGIETHLREDKYDKIIDVLRNDLKNLNVNSDDIVCILLVTCPLREPQDIVNARNIFLENDAKFTVVSVKESETPVQMSFKRSNGHLIPMMPTELKYSTKKQDHYPTYFFNDAIIIDTVANFLDPTRSLYGDWPVPYEMPWERSIAIDYEFQLKIARLLGEEKRKWRNLKV